MLISWSELQNVDFISAVFTVWREAWPLLASGLAAGFVDSIAGGGGLITVPAYLAAGVPNALLLGTNKCMSSLGTTVAVARYARAGLMPRLSPLNWALLCLAAMVASALGAALSQLPAVLERLHLLVPVMLFAVMGFLAKKWFWDPKHAGILIQDDASPQEAERALRSPFSGFVIATVGGYDGLFGPGTGTFFLSFLEKIGLGTVNANAVTKVLNLASNLGALACFAVKGRVLWPVGVAVAAGYMAGNYLGSGFVLRRGQRLVRGTVMAMTSLMLLKYMLTR